MEIILLPKLNFFFVGAPKCGTTSIAHVLSKHPNIFLSNPKEPHFFEKDIDRGIKSLEGYKALFKKARKCHTVIGEASTSYLYSKTAIPNLVVHYPDAKYLVAIRNPYEMAISLHRQAILSNYEDKVDFCNAWEAQGERKRNINVPKSCPNKTLLYYKDRCSVGDQIERLYQLAPRDKICIVFLEDLKLKPDWVFKCIYQFLNVRPTKINTYPVLNKGSKLRWPYINKITIWFGIQKRKLGINHSFGIADKIIQIASKNIMSEPLIRDEILEDMDNVFLEQINKIEKITGKDLSHWRNYRNML